MRVLINRSASLFITIVYADYRLGFRSEIRLKIRSVIVRRISSRKTTVNTQSISEKKKNLLKCYTYGFVVV